MVKRKLLIPSIATLFSLVFFLGLLLTPGRDLLKDCDTGFHIRTGEYILETLSIPKYDIFSFRTPSREWINTAWLSDVIMALIHKISGLTGIVVFFALLISLSYFLFFKVVQAKNVNIIFVTIITFIIILFSEIHALARPHIFSWIFVLIWYYVLDSFWYKQNNYLYLLPPLMLLWVNLHGSFLLGFVLLGIYFVGDLINLFTMNKQVYMRNAKILGLTIALCVLAACVNPYGYHLIFYPFELVSNKFIVDRISEFLSPNFHELNAIFFELLLLLSISIFLLSTKRVNTIELILIIFFTHMGFYSIRNVVYFGIIVAPILGKHAESILQNSKTALGTFLKRREENLSAIDGSSYGYIWIFLVLSLVVAGVKVGLLKYAFDEKVKPVTAVNFLQKENIQGNMFNDDEFGDYIIYSAYPQYKVFIDGRIGAAYEDERFKEYLKVIHFELGWEQVIWKYDMKWIIFETDSALSRFLLERRDWHLIYSDKVANIFVRNIPEYQDLIRKYQNVKPIFVERRNNY